MVVGVELSARVGREFLEKVAKARGNVIPFISDARETEKFGGFGKMDVVYCDIAQSDQTDIAIANARTHLKEGREAPPHRQGPEHRRHSRSRRRYSRRRRRSSRDAGFVVERSR